MWYYNYVNKLAGGVRMRVFVMIETDFKITSSCGTMFAGVKNALRKKRVSYEIINDVTEIKTDNSQTFLIIVSTNMDFISNSVAYCDAISVHPIILTPYLPHSLTGVYSTVTADVRQSMRYIMSYLKNAGKSHPAIYGMSEFSFSDMARKEKFLEKHILPTSNEDVFYNKTTLDDCFEKFLLKIDEYDCVICPNDYVAIHFVNSLKSHNYPVEKFTIISYGQLMIASKFHPEIISISVGYENYGKAAVMICETLQNNPELLYMSLSIKNKINADEHTGDAKTLSDVVLSSANSKDIFYHDPDVKRMIVIEKLLNSCDSTDLEILDMLIKNASYEEISDACFLSVSTTKYRVRRMFNLCGCHSKTEFAQFIEKYI